ncbi:MAG: type II toxin-antitoxin system death-on-curing family toxin [Chloroflexota bacterium]|nr:type II toxin-antitoxin system death-on-curing family toxin [Chloroflexota bacterium]
MSEEPTWLPRLSVELLHRDQLVEHGGLTGLRYDNLLESALERPRMLWHYEHITDLAVLAAALGYGLARRHAFADGNKRIAFIAMGVFLDLNGHQLDPAEPDVIETMRAVAAGDWSEADLAAWIERHLD